MKINIFGLGYVGSTTAACLAMQGHHVTGIDIDRMKVQMINKGESPIIESGLQENISKAVASGCLKANFIPALASDVSFVCVGTPGHQNGSLRLDHIVRVAEQLGYYLKKLNAYHVVNIRSTVLPGTVEDTLIPIIEERSGKKTGTDFGVCMNPEFMREGSSVHDFFHPAFTIIGELDEQSGDQLSKIYQDIQAPIIRTTIKVAEMIKYACNAFHALKISFANEIGNFCKRLDIDSHEVMDIFCKDKKLNISSSYLKPGFAFGGSCLPKDLRSLIYEGKMLDLDMFLLEAIMRSNERQIGHAFELINQTTKKKVGFLGISFKQGTDDLRESPVVELIERLIGKGYQVSLFDAEVSLAKIYGANRRFIEEVIPHISSLLKSSVQEVIQDSEVIVVGNYTKAFKHALAGINHDKKVIDLVRIVENHIQTDFYEGICW